MQKKTIISAGLVFFLIGLCGFAPKPSFGGVYRIQGKGDWEQWTYPKGAAVLEDDGSIGLKWFRARINAVEDATQFQHESKDAGGLVSGGIRNAGSNQAAAAPPPPSPAYTATPRSPRPGRNLPNLA